MPLEMQQKKQKNEKEKQRDLRSQKKKRKEDARKSEYRLKQLEKNTKEQNKRLRKVLKKQKLPTTVQNTIQYKKMYEDGICQVVNGVYSKTIKFEDINYQIARKEEQIDIFTKYCEFLNYFDASIKFQITIMNRTIDEEDFRKSWLLPEKDDNYKAHREEYNRVINDNAMQGQNNVKREKYLTFSVFANNYDSAIQHLVRVETDVLNNFKSLGCEARSLSGVERLELLHNVFNQDKEKYSFNYDYLVNTDLSTKDFICPDYFDFSDKTKFEFDDKFGQVLYLMDLPPDLSDKLLAELSDTPINMSINLHINSVEQMEAFELVKRKISFMEQQKIDEQKKALKAGYDVEMLPYELKYSLNEAYQLLDDLQNKNQRMFKVSMLIYAYAKDEEQLENYVYQIKAMARKNNCKVGDLKFMQEQGLNSSLPLGLNHVDIKRTLTTASTAVFVPFTTVELFQSGGMYYGLNALSRNLIFFNRKSLKNGNGFILGTPGSGKSFAAKREIINVLLNTEDEVLIIDPESEYTPLVKGFEGEIIHISAGSKNHINPMDITMNYSDDEDPLLLKAEFILSLCELLVGGRSGLTAAEKTIIDRCVKLTYKDYFAKKLLSTKSDVPTLVEFYNTVMEQPEPEARSIGIALELYVTGSLDVFSKQTNIDITNRLVVFDIKDLGKQLRTFGMLIVLDQIWNRITQNRALGRRTWIFIDEIYLLFQNEYSANFLFELYKRARKWGGIPTGITQNVEDLLVSDVARRMMSNSEYIMMLNQATSDRQELAELLDISEQQLGYVTNSPEGQGLMFCGTSIIPFMDKFPSDTNLYKMMTTKPEEI